MKRVTHEEVFSTLVSRYGAHSAGEIAWALHISDSTARRRLNELATAGWVAKLEAPYGHIYRAKREYRDAKWAD